MPYEWSPPPQSRSQSQSQSQGQTADWHLSLWPYRSLSRKHFVIFIGATAALAALPLLTVLGEPVLWALLPFFAMMLSGIWYALHVTYRRGEILEELSVGPETTRLVRHDPRGEVKTWQANRYWVSVHLHPTAGPVANYLTLRGGDREVEIGAFLDPSERLALYDELRRALR